MKNSGIGRETTESGDTFQEGRGNLDTKGFLETGVSQDWRIFYKDQEKSGKSQGIQ